MTGGKYLKISWIFIALGCASYFLPIYIKNVPFIVGAFLCAAGVFLSAIAIFKGRKFLGIASVIAGGVLCAVVSILGYAYAASRYAMHQESFDVTMHELSNQGRTVTHITTPDLEKVLSTNSDIPAFWIGTPLVVSGKVIEKKRDDTFNNEYIVFFVTRSSQTSEKANISYEIHGASHQVENLKAGDEFTAICPDGFDAKMHSVLDGCAFK